MNALHSIEDINTFIENETLSLVYISQPNCSICHALLPQVEELLREYPRISSRHVDAEEVPEVAGRFSVMTVPAVLVFAEGKEMFRKARFVPMGELNQQLAKLNHFLNE
ncbi:thioredoxin family protein [Halobacillus locisalis]|uniref:Thioredoxin family protein n=1 Tax=Halobacillus locisalis TaxID=220753 RepID=A0A838CWV4_9BACI|nr:thioredoxin family protein [Halobacillus locisalis]MBA2176391.1 thioredoxin family protein [Halobacillus locisalis]